MRRDGGGADRREKREVVLGEKDLDCGEEWKECEWTWSTSLCQMYTLDAGKKPQNRRLI